MLTTAQLVKWAFAAGCDHEQSWNDKKHIHNKKMDESIESTKPVDAEPYEQEIVSLFLFRSWNDVQDWEKTISSSPRLNQDI